MLFTVFLIFGKIEANDRGEATVEQLIKDRPSLKPILIKNDTIWNWLVANFSKNLFWNSFVSPANPWQYHAYSEFQGNGFVDIHVDNVYRGGEEKGTQLSGQEVLGHLIFEILNDAHPHDASMLGDLVRSGKISRDDFIRKVCKSEYETCLQESNFYLNLWLPYATKHNIDPCPQYWHYPTSPTFNEWLASFPRNGYPWDTYGNYYDIETSKNADSTTANKLTGQSKGVNWNKASLQEKKAFCISLTKQLGGEKIITKYL